ncbi:MULTISPECIES: sirohydrochlorin cobaltochelatase [Prosthecochloris]|uniref:Sirohydrochlorin cobaltochelatase n=1 Tax=Prosthecochloris vibrioformis TaxID=1098 RepID=A0A5C4S0Z9_PROVB|nr:MULTISPECIES: sirohydrochlorin cobaltochelatase [Prosthecochloris]ANT65048.1 Sirohydrochlorin cobaltochelatase CbiKP precursor [Prosthecochloris sp. CIB 2401]TNJ36889.1 sirohydrochlorin cobaltochelatase [Prosthecochloris vibrioformis]
MGRSYNNRKQIDKQAILLAHFGTSFQSALPSLDNIRLHVSEAFPDVEVRFCFTSNMIRNIWAARRRKAAAWLEKGISEEVLNVQSFLGAVGVLQSENFRTIIVQPTHVYHGEQYEDLKSYVTALQSIRTIKEVWSPFSTLALSRPALGTYGIRHDYLDDLHEVVGVLEEDVRKARELGASMLYIAHGNDFFSSGVFNEMLHVLRMKHPDTPVHIGMVEGFPGIDATIRELRKDTRSRVFVKPFMITAGDHAHHDIDNEEPDSWRGMLEAAGYEVVTEMNGLGSHDAFAEIFVERIRQTADAHGIDLHRKPVGVVQ